MWNIFFIVLIFWSLWIGIGFGVGWNRARLFCWIGRHRENWGCKIGWRWFCPGYRWCVGVCFRVWWMNCFRCGICRLRGLDRFSNLMPKYFHLQTVDWLLRHLLEGISRRRIGSTGWRCWHRGRLECFRRFWFGLPCSSCGNLTAPLGRRSGRNCPLP